MGAPSATHAALVSLSPAPLAARDGGHKGPRSPVDTVISGTRRLGPPLCLFLETVPESPCISQGLGKEDAARSQNLPEVNMVEGLFKKHEQKSEEDRPTER